jgi:hypothetical protein
MTDAEELEQQFKLVCRKCNSENVRVDIEQGIDYGGMTGWSPGHLAIGCNDCGKNDYFLSI